MAFVEGRLDAWAAQRSTESLGPWRRVYGKLRPQRSPWAVLVYEAERGPTVQVRLLEAATRGRVRARAAGDLGPVEILSCTEDPALPGLPAVLAALDSLGWCAITRADRCTVRGARTRAIGTSRSTPRPQTTSRRFGRGGRPRVPGALSFAVAEPHGWDARTLVELVRRRSRRVP